MSLFARYTMIAISFAFAFSACHKETNTNAKTDNSQISEQTAQKDDEAAKPDETNVKIAAPSSIYDFTARSWDGKDIALKTYEGKVILIVNTATACGFTPQYGGLEVLYNKYHEKGLEILDFPCNQFGSQAPGTDAEIHDFRINDYHVSFPQFAKVDVNGEHASPIFKYLVSLKGFSGFDPNSELTPILDQVLSKENPNYKDTPDIKWNFTKFLFDRKGNLIDRYEPTTTPEALDGIIESHLK